jgi:phosphoenolpyruvate carboxykinase (ATP)
MRAEEVTLREFVEAPRKIYREAKAETRLTEGLSLAELKAFALKQNGVMVTQMKSLAVDSEPMSRCAPKTKNSIDDEFGDEELRLARQAVEVLRGHNLVSVDVVVGEKADVTARVLVPEKYAHVAYGMKMLLGELEGGVAKDPTYHIVYFTDGAFEANKKIEDLRQKDIEIRLWMGRKKGEQVKIIRNSTYIGEGKKGIFQFEDWRVKAIDNEGIFLHAGVRRDHLWVYDYGSQRPELKERATIVGGLTATGKTTTLCRTFTRIPKEMSEMVGDDGGVLRYDGSFTVFEPGGLYVKTDGIDIDQPEIFKAASSGHSLLENVSISKYPYLPHFSNTSKTKNGRAVVRRENLEIASTNLTVDKVQYIIILTRNPLINAISRLTAEQAVMQLIYGESVESSGGNPAEAGNFKREFFLDPFVSGNRLEHALKFYEILRENPGIWAYLANTGHIGDKDMKVDVWDSFAIYNDLLRDRIIFSERPDELWYYYPIRCDRAKLSKLRALTLFEAENREKMVKAFLLGRRRYLKDFEERWGEIPSRIKDSLRYE